MYIPTQFIQGHIIYNLYRPSSNVISHLICQGLTLSARHTKPCSQEVYFGITSSAFVFQFQLRFQTPFSAKYQFSDIG